MEEKNKSTDLRDPESRVIDGWPTWLEIRRGILVLIFILAPAVILSSYLPAWIQSYHITGEALWGLKRKGVPDEVIQPMLKMRGPTYFFKSSLLAEVEKKIPADQFKKHRIRIERSLTAIPIENSRYFFLPILVIFYGIVWWFIRPYEARGWF
jgi:hypothetical protein